MSKHIVTQTLPAHDGAVLCAALNTSGNTLLSGSVNGVLKVWQFNESVTASVVPDVQRTFRSHGSHVTAVAVDGAGEVAVAGYADARVQVFDVLAGTCIATVVSNNYSATSRFFKNALRHEFFFCIPIVAFGCVLNSG